MAGLLWMLRSLSRGLYEQGRVVSIGLRGPFVSKLVFHVANVTKLA